MAQGWIGVDLDGTLAQYDGWKGPMHIGRPVANMVTLVRGLLADKQLVKVFTARVSAEGLEADDARAAIQNWLEVECGLPRLEVTCVKDFGMIILYDDRCVRVEKNTGRLIGA